jgi:hypothetical protein
VGEMILIETDLTTFEKLSNLTVVFKVGEMILIETDLTSFEKLSNLTNYGLISPSSSSVQGG